MSAIISTPQKVFVQEKLVVNANELYHVMIFLKERSEVKTGNEYNSAASNSCEASYICAIYDMVVFDMM